MTNMIINCYDQSGAKNRMWRGGNPHCPVCQKLLGDRRSKYCKRHRIYTDEHRGKMAKTMSIVKKGIKPSLETKRKMSAAQPKGGKHHKWVGDKVSYGALHSWVRRQLGTPSSCKHCQNNNLSRRQYHWANISRKYLRDVNDWMRLCVSCHFKYDKKPFICPL